jgi:hypothetical protein
MLSLISDKKTQFKEAFLEVKKVIEDGWCQHHYATEKEHCLVGAINNISSRNMFLGSELMKKFIEANKLPIVARNCTITFWNDAPGRTKKEVLAALDRTIEYLEAV